MKKIKAYFFQKDLEDFKKTGVAKPNLRTGSILFILDNSNQDITAMINQIEQLMAASKFRRYFLIYDPSNQITEESSYSRYTKKDLNWRSGFSNTEVLSLLRQAHHLVLFPQQVFKKDFEFISKIASTNFKIGHQAQAEAYTLDIGFDLDSSNIKDFIKQLFLISPELLERGSKKKETLLGTKSK